MADLRWLTDHAAWPAQTRRWAPIAVAVALVLFWLGFDWGFLISLVLALLVGVAVVRFTRGTPAIGIARPPVMPAPRPAPEPVAPVAQPAPPPAETAPEPVPPPVEVVATPEAAAEAASERVRAAARAAGEAARMMEAPGAASRPARLEGPRAGGADDLKRIRGVGPKLEVMLHGLGFYHFDQIAAWTPEEVTWVDSNLEGFGGRVTRDRWVEQARELASGGATDGTGRDGE